jgi:hypothetical protein
VDESDNSCSVQLVSGYGFVRDAPPQLGSGRLYQRARDAGAIPVGAAHAVRFGEQDAACGTTMKMITNNPWPPGMGSLCQACQEALR